MRYQPPVNKPATVEDPEPSYFDGNSQAGIKGAIPPAKSIEHPQREILAVVQAAGLVPNDGDLTQLLQAIQLLIGGVGAPTASFALNPVFPDVITNGGVISIAASNGQVVIATGQQWVHRGGNLFNSSDSNLAARTKATVPNKTYHLRWRYNAGSPDFVLLDVTDGSYNPGAKAEDHSDFDTAYDDMLIAKVVTDASNVPTVTALRNLASLSASIDYSKTSGIVQQPTDRSASVNDATFTYNWARSPKTRSINAVIGATSTTGGAGLDGVANRTRVMSLTRYRLVVQIFTDFAATVSGIYADATANVSA